MTGGQLFLLGYFLGAILSLVVYSALVASKDPPKPHTTCKDCVHRNKQECPFYHLKEIKYIDHTEYQWTTGKDDDFYCKEAQNIGLGTKRK